MSQNQKHESWDDKVTKKNMYHRLIYSAVRLTDTKWPGYLQIDYFVLIHVMGDVPQFKWQFNDPI